MLISLLFIYFTSVIKFAKISHYPSFFFLFFLFCRDLAAFDKSRDQAIHTYQEHRASMHPVTAMLVGKDLKVD